MLSHARPLEPQLRSDGLIRQVWELPEQIHHARDVTGWIVALQGLKVDRDGLSFISASTLNRVRPAALGAIKPADFPKLLKQRPKPLRDDCI
jgi:hypothetical protein